MKTSGITRLALSLVLTATLFAAPPPTLDALKAKAEQTRGGDQGRLYAEVARELVEVADHQYIDGDVEKAENSVKDIVSYAGKARESLRGSKRKIKETEILLRKTQRRLDDVRRTLAASDQPKVQDAVAKLEVIRRELLDQMFSK